MCFLWLYIFVFSQEKAQKQYEKEETNSIPAAEYTDDGLYGKMQKKVSIVAQTMNIVHMKHDLDNKKSYSQMQ